LTSCRFDSILSVSSPRPAHRSLQALMASGGAPPPKEARVVSDEDLNTYAEKTEFYLRMTEILRENSSSAELVVMTLPLPMNASNLPLPHTLYMAWLDVMTRDMPPFLLVRGNQESVLTFYS
jgi:solute carrier family 12 sodium/potassium/chloride transporter 2